MGSYVSIEECKSHYNKTVICHYNFTVNRNISDFAYGEVPADADIAGIGIVSVFIGVTAFALILSAVHVLWHLAKTFKWKTRYPKTSNRRCSSLSVSMICESLVMSCSDQQLFTGGAYALTLRYWKGCEITAYHYDIVSNMMLLTCATHLMSVTIVRNYWRYPWLACLRVIIVTGVFLVTGLLLSNQNATTTLRFPSAVPPTNERDSPIFLPAACFQGGAKLLASTLDASFASTDMAAKAFLLSEPGNHVQGWNYYLIILLWYILAFIVDVARFLQRGMENVGSDGKPGRRRRFVNWLCDVLRLSGKPARKRKMAATLLLSLYLLGGISVSAVTVWFSAHYMMSLRGWTKASGWLLKDDGGQSAEDDATSFGQLVPIFLSLLTLFSFAQVITEMGLPSNEGANKTNGSSSNTDSLTMDLGPHKLEPGSYVIEVPATPGSPWDSQSHTTAAASPRPGGDSRVTSFNGYYPLSAANLSPVSPQAQQHNPVSPQAQQHSPLLAGQEVGESYSIAPPPVTQHGHQHFTRRPVPNSY